LGTVSIDFQSNSLLPLNPSVKCNNRPLEQHSSLSIYEKSNGPFGKGYYSIPVAQQCGDGISVFVCTFSKDTP